MLASRDRIVSQQKKKIDKLLDRVTYQDKTIELLQEILNENTLPTDTSLGNFVYQELERLGLADEEILKLMQNFVSINYEDIPTYMSIKDFTTKLIDIASEGILKNTLHESTHGHMDVNKIEFCSSVQDNLPIDPRDVFKSNDSKIFATFKTDQITDNAVLAKWYRVDSPQIYLFDRFPIDPNKDSNYVWLDTKGQADAGQYTVEIYSITDGLDPIASGEYAIVNSTPDIIAFEGRFL